jgi:hypothetical protein
MVYHKTNWINNNTFKYSHDYKFDINIKKIKYERADGLKWLMRGSTDGRL